MELRNSMRDYRLWYADEIQYEYQFLIILYFWKIFILTKKSSLSDLVILFTNDGWMVSKIDIFSEFICYDRNI